MKKLTFLIICTTLLISCSTGGPKLDAERMKTDGLLVGQLLGRDGAALLYNANATINGKIYKGAVRRGYIRLQLPPGDYQLTNVKQVTTSSSSFGGVTVTRSYQTDHAIQASFSIKAGAVTNLGAIIAFYVDRGRTLKQLFVDNTAEMQQLLKQEHPEIYAIVKNNPFNRSRQQYLNKQQIAALRKGMVLNFYKTKLSGYYTHGGLGILAKLHRNKKGQIDNVSIYETGTLNNIDTCSALGKRYACIVPHPTKNDQLFITQGNGFVKHTLPVAANRTALFLVGRNAVVMATPDMTLYTSTNNGGSWQTYTGARRAKVSSPPKTNAIKLSYGKQGYYLYSTESDKTIVYRPYQGGDYQKIAAPQQDYEFTGLWETGKGLYSEPSFTIFGDADMLFLPKGSTTWLERKVPATDCKDLKVLDYTQDKVAALCNTIQISTDTGITWRQGVNSDLK